MLRPLDRRREKDDDWLEGYLEELVTEQPDRRNLKRLFGWLGVSRWRPPDEPNDRAHYNLACLFSRLAEQDVTQRDAHLERSASHLERCLAGEWGARRGASAGWAARDPGLSGLRELDDEDRFEGIVDPEAKGVRKPVPIPSAGRIRLKNAAIITLWTLALATLVAVMVVMFT